MQIGVKNSTDRYTLHTVLRILLVIGLGSVAVYGLGQAWVKTIYFSFILFMFLQSKHSVLWVAVLFVMTFSPFGLFYYRWNEWVLTLTSSVGISFKSAVGIAFLLKWIIALKFRRVKLPNQLKPYFLPFGIFAAFLLLLGFYFGFSAVQLYSLTQFLPSLLMLAIAPTLFNRNEMLAFNRVIFLFTLIHTAISFADIVTSGRVINLLVFGRQTSTAAIYKEELVRLTGGMFIAFYSMVVGLYYMVSRERPFKEWFLWVVVLSSWLFILSSATRGWMTASFFIMLTFLMFYSKRSILSARTVVTTLLIVGVGLVLLPSSVKQNLGAAFNRFATVEAVTEGDLTAGGTADRWTIRGPQVLTRFDESPLLGFGYSKVTYEYFDGHVGNHSLLLVGGVVGFLVVWLTVISIVVFLYRRDFYAKTKGVFVFGLSLLGIMIIHSTSRNMVSFLMPADSAFFLSMIFNLINLTIYDTKTANAQALNKETEVFK